MVRNRELRKKAKMSGVKLWQIAEKLNLTDGNFSRLLRKELSEEKKNQILSIITELKSEV